MSPRITSVQRRDIGPLGVIEPPPIHVTTPTFDGSLAMLFTCVRDHKIDLLDVPLFPICEAYFLYLIQIERHNLDESAAALAALAYLLERKAWFLLPSAEPEPEMDEALPLPEPSAHEFRLAIEALSRWQEERSNLFFRSPGSGPNPYELPFSFEEVTASDLAREFERIMRHAIPEPFEPPSKARISLQEQMSRVLMQISFEWKSLRDLISGPYTRTEAVYSFLAVLELIRLGQIRARMLEDEVVFSRA